MTNVILKILDQAAENFDFPMLDNGYVYLAGARLSVFCSNTDWALVFEVFGFSPRAEHPDLSIVTIGSRLKDRNLAEDYVTTEAYENYLQHNPYNDFRTFYPIENDSWMDGENSEMVDLSNKIKLRGKLLNSPSVEDYQSQNIDLEEPQPAVFELCRYLAALYRDDVLANSLERRVSVLSNLELVLTLEDWLHPDLAGNQKPSETESFQQLAKVLSTGDPSFYQPTVSGNTHWSNWPESGTL